MPFKFMILSLSEDSPRRIARGNVSCVAQEVNKSDQQRWTRRGDESVFAFSGWYTGLDSNFCQPLEETGMGKQRQWIQ